MDLVEQIDDIDVSASLENRRRDLRRRGFPRQIIEPLDLLLGASGNESRREYLAKRGVVFRPTDAHQVDDRAVLAFVVVLPSPTDPPRLSPLPHTHHPPLR